MAAVEPTTSGQTVFELTPKLRQVRTLSLSLSRHTKSLSGGDTPVKVTIVPDTDCLIPSHCFFALAAVPLYLRNSPATLTNSQRVNLSTLPTRC